MLKYVRLTQRNWVNAGKNTELCAKAWLSHNVSNTIQVGEDEWDKVTDFIYSNRYDYAGIALLAKISESNYKQPPLTRIKDDLSDSNGNYEYDYTNYSKFIELLDKTCTINYASVIEETNNTNQLLDIACAGGACSI